MSNNIDFSLKQSYAETNIQNVEIGFSGEYKKEINENSNNKNQKHNNEKYFEKLYEFLRRKQGRRFTAGLE